MKRLKRITWNWDRGKNGREKNGRKKGASKGTKYVKREEERLIRNEQRRAGLQYSNAEGKVGKK